MVTIDCRGAAEEGKYFGVAFGESPLSPDITLTTSADLGHEFWLGKANMVNALFSGKAKASGDVSLAMKFLPVAQADRGHLQAGADRRSAGRTFS